MSGFAMSIAARLFGIAGVVCGIGLGQAFAADVYKGAWKFEVDRQDRPALGYYDTNGKTVFLVSCGVHFDILAVYPAKPKQDGRQSATITIANGKTQMDFAGFTYAGPTSFPLNTAMFNQADLGEPDLDEDKWRVLENRVFDFLDSGQPLTISAEGKSYALPPIKTPRWPARFLKNC